MGCARRVAEARRALMYRLARAAADISVGTRSAAVFAVVADGSDEPEGARAGDDEDGDAGEETDARGRVVGLGRRAAVGLLLRDGRDVRHLQRVRLHQAG